VSDATGNSSGAADYRVSDADRLAVIDQLTAHFGAGRLTAAEFDERVTATRSARTRRDVDDVLVDLPEGALAAPPRIDRGKPAGRELAIAAAAGLLALLVVLVVSGLARTTGCI